jgi:hypothetical protein
MEPIPSVSVSVVVGVFANRDDAQAAFDALRRASFRDEQVGFIARNLAAGNDESGAASHAGEGLAAGAVGGGVIGALWGLVVAAGLLPGIGPVIAGGIAAAVLASAAAGAAVAGTAGLLIGLGVPAEEAGYYERALQAGRILITVRPEGREDDALAILRACGALASEAPAAAQS